MRLFITGASGFLGKNFIEEVIKKRYKIYALSRKDRSSKKIEWLKGSLEDDWSKELKETDIFIHLASSGVQNFENKDIYETNFFNSKRILDRVVKSKYKKWLIISTSSEFGVRSKNLPKASLN